MNSPIVQNDHRLNPQIRKAGCLFRSLSMLAEIKAGTTLVPEQVEEQYRFLVDNGYMSEACFVYDHEKVVTSAQYYLEIPANVKYVFRASETGDGDFDHGGPHNTYIGHAKTVSGNGHFFVVDRHKNLIWDPWWPRPDRDYDLTFRGYLI